MPRTTQNFHKKPTFLTACKHLLTWQDFKPLGNYLNTQFENTILATSNDYHPYLRAPIQGFQYLCYYLAGGTSLLLDTVLGWPFLINKLIRYAAQEGVDKITYGHYSQVLIQDLTGYVNNLSENEKQRLLLKATSEQIELADEAYRGEISRIRKELTIRNTENPQGLRELTEMDDEQLLTWVLRHDAEYVQSNSMNLVVQSNQDFYNDMLLTILLKNDHGLHKVIRMARGFYRAIMAPSTLGAGLVIKPLQVLAAIIMLPISAIVELVCYLGTGLCISYTCIPAAIAAIPMLLLNAPIYAMHLIEGCWTLCCPIESTPPALRSEISATANGSSSLEQTEACDPGHFGSPISRPETPPRRETMQDVSCRLGLGP